MESTSASSDATAVRCVHSDRCGGCAFMGVPAEVQLQHKHSLVSSACEGYPQLRAAAIADVAPADPMLGYRTRAKLVVSERGEIGLFARGTHEVVDVPHCRVLHPNLIQVAAELRSQLCEGHGVTAVDLRLVHDDAEQPGVLVTLTGLRSARERLCELAAKLATHANVRGVALRVLERMSVQQLEGVPEAIAGQAVARDRLRSDGPYTYAAHGGFVQAHRGQAAAIAERILLQLGEVRGLRVLELFAGSGGFALELCARGARVTVIERYAPALEHLARAQSEQRLTGLTVLCADAEQGLTQLMAAGSASFDVVIVNPPRRGLTPRLRAAIAQLAPRQLAYVACDPSTLARDLADFASRGLWPDELVPFDMMPFAADVETLAVLRPAAPAAIRVLYEDDELLVVDKPPHLPTVPDVDHPNSLLARLVDERALPDLAPVHRLDAGTSGVCLFAKSPRVAGALAQRLAAGHKHYLALVRGHAHKKGIVRAPLREQAKTRPAVSRYTLIERIAGHSLVRVRPEQGRTHQVRKHMAAVDHPLLGDTRYGDLASNRFFEHRHGLQRPFLHAWRVELAAAGARAGLSFQAELAPDLAAVLTSLRASS